jgi:hypothetical protein
MAHERLRPLSSASHLGIAGLNLTAEKGLLLDKDPKHAHPGRFGIFVDRKAILKCSEP